jgi:hypothetical protein
MVEHTSGSEQQITGRGGAALCYLKAVPEKVGHAFLLTSGASREAQFDDFWLVTVGLTAKGRTVTKERIAIKENDGYTPRNAFCAVPTPAKKVLLFGGQDSEKDVQFNHLFEFDPETLSLKQIESAAGDLVPPRRNSHAMVCANTADAGKAYIYGGANCDGPLKDLYELDLTTYKFKRIKLDEQ